MNITAIILAGLLLAGCDMERENQEALFKYCLFRATPASSDAIRACRDVAWPQGADPLPGTAGGTP